MSVTWIDGREVAKKWKENAAQRAQALIQKGITPHLAVIVAGENPASQVYVRNKHKSCEALGIYSEVIEMPETTTKDELIAKIDALNADVKIHGILVQLPLPEQIAAHESEILERIRPEKDVDGFHPVNVGRLVTGEPGLVPCTPFGCLRMLELAGIPIDGQRAVIIGRSNIVGKPMGILMLRANGTVICCHSRTPELASLTRQADVLVVAAGQPCLIRGDMVKPGAVVIDVAMNRDPDTGKFTGDVCFDDVAAKASYITPVPGGVGPMTRAMLMKNILAAAQMHIFGTAPVCGIES